MFRYILLYISMPKTPRTRPNASVKERLSEALLSAASSAREVENNASLADAVINRVQNEIEKDLAQAALNTMMRAAMNKKRREQEAPKLEVSHSEADDARKAMEEFEKEETARAAMRRTREEAEFMEEINRAVRTGTLLQKDAEQIMADRAAVKARMAESSSRFVPPHTYLDDIPWLPSHYRIIKGDNNNRVAGYIKKNLIKKINLIKKVS